MYHLLTKKQIESSMKDLDGWVAKDNALARHFRFEGYMDALKFVETVAVDAESRGHYPDVLFKYLEVVIMLSSHDAEGITEMDFISARAIDKLAANFSAG
jgi:4a-hydroxytetrahydrobiopterin dehydratase